MITPTTVRSLTVATLDIALNQPFGIATGAQDVARNLLVTLELADGTCGYGEAAPFAAVNGETQEGARTAIEAARAVVEGADARYWRPLAKAVRVVIGKFGSAQCAIETALLDALTKRAGVPLWAFFGGSSTALETDMTITTGGVDEAAAAAHAILARGISTIKIKIGGGDLSLDVERVAAIHAAAPDSPLLLDGNCGFSADQALQLLAALGNRGIRPALFEQPVAREDLAGMREVLRWGGVSVAADESVANAGDALNVVRERAADVVNIKLMKCGIVEALDIAAVCRASGVRLMIGGMVESRLAMTTSACFAAGLGGFDFVDLDTPMFMVEDPFTGGWQQRGATLDLANIQAGHGLVPR